MKMRRIDDGRRAQNSFNDGSGDWPADGSAHQLCVGAEDPHANAATRGGGAGERNHDGVNMLPRFEAPFLYDRRSDFQTREWIERVSQRTVATIIIVLWVTLIVVTYEKYLAA